MICLKILHLLKQYSLSTTWQGLFFMCTYASEQTKTLPSWSLHSVDIDYLLKLDFIA